MFANPNLAMILQLLYPYHETIEYTEVVLNKGEVKYYNLTMVNDFFAGVHNRLQEVNEGIALILLQRLKLSE